MPIIISRDGSAEPVITNAPTPEQRQALWAHIVKSWCEQHPEALRTVAQPAPAQN